MKRLSRTATGEVNSAREQADKSAGLQELLTALATSGFFGEHMKVRWTFMVAANMRGRLEDFNESVAQARRLSPCPKVPHSVADRLEHSVSKNASTFALEFETPLARLDPLHGFADRLERSVRKNIRTLFIIIGTKKLTDLTLW